MADDKVKVVIEIEVPVKNWAEWHDDNWESVKDQIEDCYGIVISAKAEVPPVIPGVIDLIKGAVTD